jgi:large repetitive protein
VAFARCKKSLDREPHPRGSLVALVRPLARSLDDPAHRAAMEGLMKHVMKTLLCCIAVSGPALAQDPQPTAPADFAATVTATEVDLQWGASAADAGVVAYEVESCLGAECADFQLAGATTGTSATDSGLLPSTTYRYRVRALDAQGSYGAYSSVRTVSTNLVVPGEAVVRVNSGGEAYVDAAGNIWDADRGFNTGLFITDDALVSGTSDSLLYQSVRWVIQPTQALEYSFDLPAGDYLVKLHFAEIYSGAFVVGGRVFNVEVEGQTAISDLDVFAEVGANAALVEEVNTSVVDGQLDIRFVRGPIQEPMVSAIEVIALATPDTTAPSPVANLTINRVSNSELDLDWDDATDDTAVQGYSVERCMGAGCSNFQQLAADAAPPFSNTGLVCGTVYRYRVRAFDEAGNFGAYSNVVTSPNCNQCKPRHHRHHHHHHHKWHKRGRHHGHHR